MQWDRIRALASKLPVNEFLVGLAVLVSACIAIRLTRAAGGIALLWPASAIAAALLIRFPRLHCGMTSVVVLGALLLSNFLSGQRPLPTSAGFVAVNMAEIALMVAVFRFVRVFPYPRISITQAAIMTVVFGVTIPGLVAILGAVMLNSHLGLAWSDGLVQWWASHAVGACLFGPPIILFSGNGMRRLLRGRYLVENALTFGLCLAGCYLTICFVRFPFVTLGLMLLAAAFRLGGFGASILSLAFGLLITGLWILGIRPLGLDPGYATGGTLVALPAIALLATVMPPVAVGLGSDARRAAARALRVSERRFRESLEHSPVGMVIADLSGVWGFTNLTLQEMLGYDAEEFRAMPPGGPLRPDEWEETKARWTRLLAGEINSFDVVRSFQHKNGHWVWAQVAIYLLRDDEGHPQHAIAQIESLEARRLAEQKLAGERERLRITLASIKDAVITTDANTRITYVNAAAESLLALEFEAVEGRRVDEVIHLMDPTSAKAAANLIGQSALHNKSFRREHPCVLHRPDGTMCYILDVVSPVVDASGILTGMVIVFHDATFEFHRTQELQHRAWHDALTGLSNRAEFEQRMRETIVRSTQLERPAALLMVDLDRFKGVNDTGGHAAGDALLRTVAQTCLNSVRASDVVARLGGDEFAVILNNCPQDRAEAIAGQILRALNPLEMDWEGSRFAVGASLGLAMHASTMTDEGAWLKAADSACYAAKRDGRGCLRIAVAEQRVSARMV